MRIHLALAVALTLLAQGANAATDPAVHYHVSTAMAGDDLQAIVFDVRFKADEDGQTEIDFPDHWGGGREFYKALKDIQITGASHIETPPDHPEARILTSKPNAPITVTYRLYTNRTKGEEGPLDTDMRYPIIGPERFYLTGQQVMLWIDGRDDAPATFSYKMPEGWTFASDLEDLQLGGGTPNQVIPSVMLAGRDVHIDTIKTAHTRLRIATAGRFDFSAADFQDRIARVIETEQAFWNDGQPAFLVTLAPLESGAGAQSMHGTGLDDAFAMVTTPSVPVERLNVTLAHEYFHSWNYRKLGSWYSTGDEALGYWFSEGFTDYYGRKLALRAGVIDLRQFVALWNQALGEYAASPHRTTPYAEIRDNFWKDEDWGQMPYDRGSQVAALWNRRWHNQGVTLDRFMLALRDRVATDPAFAALPLPDRLKSIASQLGVSVEPELSDSIDRGDALSLPMDGLGGCLRVVNEDAADFDPGYDTEKTIATGVFSSVDPEGNAYKAGLRDGMKRLARLSGEPNDSSVPLSYRVTDPEGAEKIISYLPQGKMHHPRQRVIMPEGLDAEALKTCAAEVAAY